MHKEIREQIPMQTNMQHEKKLANLKGSCHGGQTPLSMHGASIQLKKKQHSSMAASISKQNNRTLDTPASNVGCGALQHPTQANSIMIRSKKQRSELGSKLDIKHTMASVSIEGSK